MTGLTTGKWRLVLDSERWMFVLPPIVEGPTEDGRFEVVAACSFFAIAEDFMTEERIEGVRARVEIDDRPITADIVGRNGVVAHRAPARGANMSEAELVLDAPGYQTRRRSFPIPTALRLPMLPDVEPNVTLRLRHEDGSPYTGPVARDADVLKFQEK